MQHRRVLGVIIVVATLVAACGNDASDPSTEGASGEQVSTTRPNATSMPEPTTASADGVAASYTIVDTGQAACYDEQGVITCPEEAETFFGQDGNYTGNQSSYVDHGDGTVTDLVTGLMWQQDPGEKMTYGEAAAGAESFALAGYDDWRLPTIKELYSLIDFSGTDPSACQSTDGCGAIPFIDDVFAFEYGDTGSGERLIDSQWATSSIYEGLTMGGAVTMFGVNFADGRIKGYPTGADPSGADKEFFVVYVRGNEAYGQNDLVANGDGTVSDLATLLMWQQDDSAGGMEWEESLAYCENLDTGGYDDWRLPNAKELQSIVDYTRSPQSTGTAAIDPVFETTAITDEGGDLNFGMYWSSTTHASMQGGQNAVYVAFGEALGYMTGPGGGDATLMDVHGAGAQRSDPKTGDASDYPTGHGPQGDVIRIDNMVRCVRSGVAEITTGLLVEATAWTGDSGQTDQEAGPPAMGGPLADAAAALGVSENALAGAMGDPTQGPPDFAEVARILGVSVEELMSVLPAPSGG